MNWARLSFWMDPWIVSRSSLTESKVPLSDLGVVEEFLSLVVLFVQYFLWHNFIRTPALHLLSSIWSTFWWVVFICCREASELANINWDNIAFLPIPTDFMYAAKSLEDGIFTKGQLQRFGPIHLSPCAGVLNYGQVSGISLCQYFLVSCFRLSVISHLWLHLILLVDWVRALLNSSWLSYWKNLFFVTPLMRFCSCVSNLLRFLSLAFGF